MNHRVNTEMPNLFVIGAEKCGTTSLYHYLNLHPEISMSSRPEPGYFGHSSRDYRLIRVRDRTAYLNLFAAGVPVKGDSTPAYSSFPEIAGVPARIAAEVPKPKFIYLVRDPIERIRSALRHWAAFGRFGVGDDLIQVESIPEVYMISRSRYMVQLEQYLEHFPPESILVVDSDRLRSERRTVLSEIFGFLEVDPDFEHPGFTEVRNSAKANKMPPATWRRLRSTAPASLATRIAPVRTKLAVRRLRLRLSEVVGEPIPEIVLTENLKFRLRKELAPEVEALREFTGKDFSGWSF